MIGFDTIRFKRDILRANKQIEKPQYKKTFVTFDIEKEKWLVKSKNRMALAFNGLMKH